MVLKEDQSNELWLAKRTVILLLRIYNYYNIFHFRRTFDIYGACMHSEKDRLLQASNFVHLCHQWHCGIQSILYSSLEHILYVPYWMRSISCDVWAYVLNFLPASYLHFQCSFGSFKIHNPLQDVIFDLMKLKSPSWANVILVSSKGHITKTFILACITICYILAAALYRINTLYSY